MTESQASQASADGTILETWQQAWVQRSGLSRMSGSFWGMDLKALLQREGGCKEDHLNTGIAFESTSCLGSSLRRAPSPLRLPPRFQRILTKCLCWLFLESSESGLRPIVVSPPISCVADVHAIQGFRPHWGQELLIAYQGLK